jgi:hypothetical protein
MSRHSIPSLVIVVLVLLANGCSQVRVPQEDLRSAIEYRGFLPIDPLPSPWVVHVNANGQEVREAWERLDGDQKRALLPNQTSTMVAYRVDESGKATFLNASSIGSKGHYRVVMDYAWYRTDPLLSSHDSTQIGMQEVGVGLRIKAEIQTLKANLDLGSLIALGFEARAKRISGRLEVHALGMSSPDLTTLFPMPSTIDETAIQKALEALAAIKAKLGDSATKLTPQVIAIKVEKEQGFDGALLQRLP